MSIHTFPSARIQRPGDWFGVAYHARRQAWLDLIEADPRCTPEDLGVAWMILRAVDRMPGDADRFELPNRTSPAVKRLTAYGYMTNLLAALR